MTWSTLPTYLDGTVLDASKLLAIRDNINETAAARATTATGYFVATGPNSLAQRVVGEASVLTQQTGTLTSYGNITTAGPGITVTTGIRALVFTSAQLENSGNGSTWASYEVANAGVVSDAASDNRAIFNQSGATFGGRFGVTTWQVLTAQSNDFTMKYRVSSGTGTFDDRRIIVMSF